MGTQFMAKSAGAPLSRHNSRSDYPKKGKSNVIAA